MALNSSTTTAGADATATQYNNLRKDVIARAGEYAVTTGSANAYVLAVDGQIVAYETGQIFQFKVNFTNTDTCTLNVNAIGAKTMKDLFGNVLPAGSVTNGSHLVTRYDGTDIIVLSGLTDTYSVNSYPLSNWYNYTIPIISTSASTVPTGWAGSVAGTGDSYGAAYTHLQPSGGAGYAELYTLLPGNAATSYYQFGNGKDIRLKIRARLSGAGSADRQGFGFCVTTTAIDDVRTATTTGTIRFIKDGANTLYAQNANGLNTNTNISSGLTLTNWNTYEIVYTLGTDIKFYVNGVLKATHTTNLPTNASDTYIAFGFANGNGAEVMPPILSFEL